MELAILTFARAVVNFRSTGHAGPIVGWVVVGLVVIFGAGFFAARIYRGRRSR